MKHISSYLILSPITDKVKTEEASNSGIWTFCFHVYRLGFQQHEKWSKYRHGGNNVPFPVFEVARSKYLGYHYFDSISKISKVEASILLLVTVSGSNINKNSTKIEL